MNRERRRLLVALGVGTVTTLAGCEANGDGDGATSSPTSVSTPDMTPSEQTEISTDSDQTEAPTPGYQPTELVPTDGARGDAFGWSVGVSNDGTTAIIGAAQDDTANGKNAGSAYVFTRSGGSWQQQAKLTADDGDKGDGLGTEIGVSSDGTTAIIGASADEDPSGEGMGSAYVFTRSGGSWQQQAKLAAPDGKVSDSFGGSIAMSGDGTTAIIGGGGSSGDDLREDVGAAYAFE